MSITKKNFSKSSYLIFLALFFTIPAQSTNEKISLQQALAIVAASEGLDLLEAERAAPLTESQIIAALNENDITLLQDQLSRKLISKDTVAGIIKTNIQDPQRQMELLFDLGINYHDQMLLLEKISSYLEKELAKIPTTTGWIDTLNYYASRPSKKAEFLRDRASRQETITFFKQSAGFCFALSTLWAYSKRISEETTLSDAQTDDAPFFNTMYKKLALWDKKTEFSHEEKRAIERFLANLILYQSHEMDAIFHNLRTKQGDHEALMETSLGEKPVRIPTPEANKYSKEMFKKRLTLAMDIPACLVLFTMSQHYAHAKTAHEFAVYKNPHGIFYLYDSNADGGEELYSSLDELIETVWEHSGEKYFDQKNYTNYCTKENRLLCDKLHKIEFQLFSFNKNIRPALPTDFFNIQPHEVFEILSDPDLRHQFSGVADWLISDFDKQKLQELIEKTKVLNDQKLTDYLEQQRLKPRYQK